MRGEAGSGDAADQERQPVVIRHEGARRCGQGFRIDPFGGRHPRQRARPHSSSRTAPWRRGGCLRRRRLTGHRQEAGDSRQVNGIQGSDASRLTQDPNGHSREKSAGSGRDGQGAYPLKSRTSLPCDQAAVLLSEDQVAWPGQEQLQDQRAGGIV
jgi:hypothetical protein